MIASYQKKIPTSVIITSPMPIREDEGDFSNSTDCQYLLRLLWTDAKSHERSSAETIMPRSMAIARFSEISPPKMDCLNPILAKKICYTIDSYSLKRTQRIGQVTFVHKFQIGSHMGMHPEQIIKRNYRGQCMPYGICFFACMISVMLPSDVEPPEYIQSSGQQGQNHNPWHLQQALHRLGYFGAAFITVTSRNLEIVPAVRAD